MSFDTDFPNFNLFADPKMIEKIILNMGLGEDEKNYIHPNNNQLMSDKDINGEERYWIYEIHLIDRELEIGGFFEQLLS